MDDTKTTDNHNIRVLNFIVNGDFDTEATNAVQAYKDARDEGFNPEHSFEIASCVIRRDIRTRQARRNGVSVA